MIRMFSLAMAAVVLTAATAQAGVVYVAATLANTDNANPLDVFWADGSPADGSASNDGKWRYRSAASPGMSPVWEATGSTVQVEDAVEIVTTVTSLPSGTYNVYVFYNNGSGASVFPIRAGLQSDPNANQLFDPLAPGPTNGGLPSGLPGAVTGVLAETLVYDVAPPTFGPSNGLLWSASIGPAIVTGGVLSVYVDDLPANTLTSNVTRFRSWYSGIGYERVGPVPEPATLVLCGMGAVTCALTARRRNRV